jgi:hypothetical protein
MGVAEDVARIAAAAVAHAEPGEELGGMLVSETHGRRLYLCAFESGDRRTWLALGEDAEPLHDRQLVREAASLAALCELAEESAVGGDLSVLRRRLAELRETDAPAWIEEAEIAAAAMAETLQPEPRVASTAYLDRLGAAARRLEQALGQDSGSPFAAAMQSALGAVEELTADVERNYRQELS